ncbi:MAG: hypothetical protein FD133_615 [Erysipelotrichaceae bacterium]|nr:MAG: hypothetical protein FD133_615 [Erysipelotrichaceae bacterium]
MLKKSRFMRRMMVILMGIILVVVSILQIINDTSPIWLNLIFAGLGLFEIFLAVFMMRLEKKNSEELNKKAP